MMVAMLGRQDMPLEGNQWMCMEHSLLGGMHFQCYLPTQALGGAQSSGKLYQYLSFEEENFKPQ